MADRKTINKYFPPDFDPSKISKRTGKKPKTGSASLATVRLMSPFSMRCTTCGEYIYKGKKFNARKQPTGESYLGIKIIRFYIRCPRCSGEIKFKTDPKTSDYLTEYGAVRNLEPWRDREKEEETLEDRLVRLEKEEQEALEEAERNGNGSNDISAAAMGATNDPFAGLEEKVNMAKREMAIQDELEELRMRNARFEELSSGATAGNSDTSEMSAKEAKEDAEDQEAAKLIFSGTNGQRVQRALPLPSLETSAVPAMIPTKARISKKRNKLGITVKKV